MRVHNQTKPVDTISSQRQEISLEDQWLPPAPPPDEFEEGILFGCMWMLLDVVSLLLAGHAVYQVVVRPISVTQNLGTLRRGDYSPPELLVSIDFEPAQYQRGQTGEITIEFTNNSSKTIQTGDILLQMPSAWSKGFVIDYASSTPTAGKPKDEGWTQELGKLLLAKEFGVTELTRSLDFQGVTLSPVKRERLHCESSPTSLGNTVACISTWD